MKVIVPFLLLTTILLFNCSSDWKNSPNERHTITGVSPGIPASTLDSSRLTVQFVNELSALKAFIRANAGKYSDKTVFLIDMRIPSNYNRLFVVDLKTDAILERMPVAHGSGSETLVPDSLQFSNTPNSYMTSLGIYKIGASYTGSFGKSYKLHGLEKTNSKAFERLVVLHRYSCVPDGEQEGPICTSLGCPMVSENNFPILEKYITESGKPMLLKIYY